MGPNIRKKVLFGLALLTLAGAPNTYACDQPIVFSNWKSCAIGPLSETGGEADWKAVPKWTRSKDLRRWFMDDPRLLANHGLCNAKFRRVVLCAPGWQESEDTGACWYAICSGPQASKRP
nr:hypothetical protein [Rhizobium glycinendophyticum]